MEDPIKTHWSNRPTYSCIGEYQEQVIFSIVLVHISTLENIVTKFNRMNVASEAGYFVFLNFVFMDPSILNQCQ